MSRLFDILTQQFMISTGAPVSGTTLSMGCWIYCTDVTRNSAVLDLGVNGSDDHYFSIYLQGATGGDPVRLWANSGSGDVSLDTTTGMTVNTWHHVMVVVAGATSRSIFIDGGGKATATASMAVTGQDELAVGAWTGSGAPSTVFDAADARIAGIVLYNVALSDAEVLRLARRISPYQIRAQNLVSYHEVYGTTSPEPDHGGGDYALTITGTPAQADHAPVAPPFAFFNGYPFTTAVVGGADIRNHIIPAYMAMHV